jgi:hypothetical protein
MFQAGEEVTFQRVGEIIEMVDKNSDGEIDFNECVYKHPRTHPNCFAPLALTPPPPSSFSSMRVVVLSRPLVARFLGCMQVLKAGGALGGGGSAGSSAMQQFACASHRAANVIQVQGSGGAVHSISEEEREAFAEHINNVLGSDPFFVGRLPMDPQSPTALFDQCKVGGEDAAAAAATPLAADGLLFSFSVARKRVLLWPGHSCIRDSQRRVAFPRALFRTASFSPSSSTWWSPAPWTSAR